MEESSSDNNGSKRLYPEIVVDGDDDELVPSLAAQPRQEVEQVEEGNPNPNINLLPLQVSVVVPQSEDDCTSATSCVSNEDKMEEQVYESMELKEVSENNILQEELSMRKHGKYFYYDFPHYEETGAWIPVSVPPMSGCTQEDWNRGLFANGDYFPEGDMGWNQLSSADKELTMWDVVSEMLVVARGKMHSLASGDHVYRIACVSNHLMHQAWREMEQTLTDSNFNHVNEILETEPPKWLPDSSASACMLCGVRFHPIMCSRHHCRFCGDIFCSECSKGRSLLPLKFRTNDPQRVCDVCCVRLEAVQGYLVDKVSNAAQVATHDLTDLSTLRSWVNFPWGRRMEYEIYKAANTIQAYCKVGHIEPERKIPDSILRQAKGLAILTMVKVGVMVTYKTGTGVVVARRDDGSWSPPSAICSLGAGWGTQGGGELTDFIVVLRTEEAVKTFASSLHFSLGAGMSAAAGVVGRAAEADLHLGPGSYGACYTYSRSKGLFAGYSLEGSIIMTRASENSRFYGIPSISAWDILLGSLPSPPAAAMLYNALSDLFNKFGR